MYSFKEKNRHYEDLQAPEHVQSDIELLRRKDPKNGLIDSALIAPKRLYRDVLYALLDLCTREEIVLNRRLLAANVQPTDQEEEPIKSESDAEIKEGIEVPPSGDSPVDAPVNEADKEEEPIKSESDAEIKEGIEVPPSGDFPVDTPVNEADKAEEPIKLESDAEIKEGIEVAPSDDSPVDIPVNEADKAEEPIKSASDIENEKKK